jgi:hypothetical protein
MTTHTPIFTMTFDSAEDFEAQERAVSWLGKRGFSVGTMQRTDPRGIMFGEYDIEKWRNLSWHDRACLHGQMLNGGRRGPVTIEIYDIAPPEARAALAAAKEPGK